MTALPIDPLNDYKFPGIYRFTNLINGKVYVGQSKNISQRFRDHKYKSRKSNAQISRALLKYGIEQFTFEVLEQLPDVNLLNSREQHWIDFCQSCDRDKGYNTRPVAYAQREYRLPPEQIERMRETGKRLYAEGFRPFIGRVLTDEAKERARQKQRAYRLTPEQRARFLQNNVFTPERKAQKAELLRSYVAENMRCKILQIDMRSGETIKTWESLNEIKLHPDYSHNRVDTACRGYYFGRERGQYIAYESYKGFRWQRETEGKVIKEQKSKQVFTPKSKFKKIAQIDLETGVTVKVWNLVSEIVSELSLHKESIQNTCRGYVFCNRRKAYVPKLSYAGFKWQYVE